MCSFESWGSLGLGVLVCSWNCCCCCCLIGKFWGIQFYVKCDVTFDMVTGLQGALGAPDNPVLFSWSIHPPGLWEGSQICFQLHSILEHMPRSQLIPLLLIKKWKQREGCLFHPPVPVHTPVFIQTGSHCSSSVSVARTSPSFLWKTGCHPFSSIQGLFFIYPLSPTLSIFSFLWDRSHLLISMLNYLPLTKERKIQRIKLKKKKESKESFPWPCTFLQLLLHLSPPRFIKTFQKMSLSSQPKFSIQSSWVRHHPLQAFLHAPPNTHTCLYQLCSSHLAS